MGALGANLRGLSLFRPFEYDSAMRHLNQLASAAISILIIVILILLVLRLT
jgi:hypothetical protein